MNKILRRLVNQRRSFFVERELFGGFFTAARSFALLEDDRVGGFGGCRRGELCSPADGRGRPSLQERREYGYNR